MGEQSIKDIIGEDTAKACELISGLLEISECELIKKAVNEYIQSYLNDDGKAEYIDAYLMKGTTALERKAAEVEGNEIVVEKVPCKIIRKQKIYGEDYYCLICNRNIMKVPAAHVVIPG